MKKLLTASSLFFALPLIALAQTTAGGTITNIVTDIGNIINSLIPILIAATLVAFFWGLVRYVFKMGGGEGSDAGKIMMIWSLVALFVMVSVWGIIKVAQSTLGIDSSDTTITAPTVQ